MIMDWKVALITRKEIDDAWTTWERRKGDRRRNYELGNCVPLCADGDYFAYYGTGACA